jgi:hypothetical protein
VAVTQTPSEGLGVEPHADRLQVLVTRVDQTSYQFHRDSLASRLAAMATDPDFFFIVDSGLEAAQPDAVRSIPATRRLALPYDKFTPKWSTYASSH